MTPPAHRHALRYALAAGLLVGMLDLAYICTFWSFRDVGPLRILQSVAAGWVGREAALSGGTGTALLGLVSHFAIAIAMACVCFLAGMRWKALLRRPWSYGATYGVLLYAVMNYLVVPLSAAGSFHRGMFAFGWMEASHVFAHVLLVGIPCTLMARMAQPGIRGNLILPSTR